jgi:hypothetical protein
MAYLPTSGNERGRKGRLIHKHTIPIGRGQHSFCGACFWGSNPQWNKKGSVPELFATESDGSNYIL